MTEPDSQHTLGQAEHQLLCIEIEALARTGANQKEIERRVRSLLVDAPAVSVPYAVARRQGRRRPLWRLVLGA